MDAKGIARALRTQLQEMNVPVTHAQSLELVAKIAGVKDWNVLVARPQPRSAQGSGLFCPHCGAQGTLLSKADAMVEQGPWNGKSFTYEGDAPHYVCSACEGQFLEWASDWPKMLEHTETVILLRREQGLQFQAYWARVSVLLAARGDSLEDFLAEIDAEYRKCGSHGPVVYHLADLAEEGAKGATERDAVQQLWEKIPKDERDSVVNRDYLKALGIIA